MIRTAQSPAPRPDAPRYPLVLVLDIGSSSTRAVLYDADANPVPGTLVRRKSSFAVAPDGSATDDPAALLQRVVGCLDDVLAAAGEHARQIVAVGSATFVSNMLGLDEAGQPCTPILTYADTRSAGAAVELRRRLDERSVLDRTGCPLRTSYWPALLTWLRAAAPAEVKRVRRWATVHEWLMMMFLGSGTISYSVAAWTGLLNRASLQWDAELLRELGLDVAQLGTLADLDDAGRGLQAPWRERWPALADAVWVGAVGDGAAANVGSGCVDATRIALSIGTTGALRTVVPPDPAVPLGLWCYRVDRRLALLGGATSEGGNVLTWVLNTLKVDAAAIEGHLLDPAGAEKGLTVLPFVAGERSPGWAGDVKATISGISLATTPLDIARAALEGVTYRWAAIAELLRPTTADTPLLVASGGGLNHVPSWAQLIADAVGLPVAVSAEAETTSRGVALLALRAIGELADLGQLAPSLEPAFKPDPERHAMHRAARARQAELYGQLVGPGQADAQQGVQ